MLFFAISCGKTDEKSPVARDQTAASTGTTSDTSANGDPGAKLRIIHAPADAELASFLRTERLRAKADGRVLLLYAGAKWCEPCKIFHMMLSTGRLDATLAKSVLVELDVDEDTERLNAAGYKYRYVPYFALVGADGRPKQQFEDSGKDVDRAMIDRIASWQKDEPL